MKKIRTKLRPDEEIEVSDREYLDLKRQGLLREEEEPAESHGEPAPEPEGAAVKDVHPEESGDAELARQQGNAQRRLRSLHNQKKEG